MSRKQKWRPSIEWNARYVAGLRGDAKRQFIIRLDLNVIKKRIFLSIENYSDVDVI